MNSREPTRRSSPVSALHGRTERPVVKVSYLTPAGIPKTARFESDFVIGRGVECEVSLDEVDVSREHLGVTWHAGEWWARDLGSSNGTFISGVRFVEAPLRDEALSLVLTDGGPVVTLEVERPVQAQPGTPDAVQRYLDPDYEGPMGEQTVMIRRAIATTTRKQKRSYRTIIGVVVALLIGAGGLAGYQFMELRKTEAIAIEIFYAIKEINLQVSQMEADLTKMAKSLGTETESVDAQRRKISERKQKVASLEDKYQSLVQKAKPLAGTSLGKVLTDERDVIIHQVARLFGECDLIVPESFAKEVKQYIARWQATERLPNAIKRLRAEGFLPTIVKEFTDNGLPPQFLYLAMQESNFNLEAVGPKTRYGYAKGMWQFIPDTGKRYGLNIGPASSAGIFDPQDDRHDFERSTAAAASYIGDIYRTDAQASGLLVMASYNWGEGNIIKRIRKLPENPKDRNFWKLLEKYKIPDETYNYVLYIFSAAVISENPKLFGFDFDNPLADYQKYVTKS